MKSTDTVAKAYEQIALQIKNPRQLESLERIKSACDYLEHQKVKLTPSGVERYCADRGWDGPKAQSIRNSKDVLLKYLKLRASKQVLAAPRKSAERGAPAIADESLRAYVQLLQEERDQAIAAVARIERGLRSLPGLKVDDLLLGKAIQTPLENQCFRPSPVLKESVARLFDQYLLSRVGLEIFKDRLRSVVTKDVLLEKDHVSALKVLIDFSGNEP